MPALRMTITTDKDGISKDLERRMKEMPQAAGAGQYTLANAMMTSAKRRVPVKTGVLKSSGYVGMPVVNGTSATCPLGFGGPASAYALVQHERLDFKHPNGGEAKYLENAIVEYSGEKGASIFVAAVEKYLANHAQASADNPTSPGGPSSGHGPTTGGSGHRAKRGPGRRK